VKRALRIEDKHRGAPRIFLSMPEVLAGLPPDAASLEWRILDLGEVTTSDDSGLNVSELEDQVFASATGLALSFDELSRLADRTHQVIDGLFIVPADPTDSPRRADDDLEILVRSHVVVAALNSAFLLVSGPETWLEHIRNVFRDVHEEDLRRPLLLRTWGPGPSPD
jgi:hypothetical protein